MKIVITVLRSTNIANTLEGIKTYILQFKMEMKITFLEDLEERGLLNLITQSVKKKNPFKMTP